MSLRTLYAYVDGADLDDVAEILAARFSEFITAHRWVCDGAFSVNQRYGRETCTNPDDLPLWDLGLNLPLPEPGTESPEWFSDIEAIARFLGALHTETGREFIIGVANSRTRITDDLLFVVSSAPDVKILREIIGAPYDRTNVA